MTKLESKFKNYPSIKNLAEFFIEKNNKDSKYNFVHDIFTYNGKAYIISENCFIRFNSAYLIQYLKPGYSSDNNDFKRVIYPSEHLFGVTFEEFKTPGNTLGNIKIDYYPIVEMHIEKTLKIVEDFDEILDMIIYNKYTNHFFQEKLIHEDPILDLIKTIKNCFSLESLEIKSILDKKTKDKYFWAGKKDLIDIIISNEII